MHFKLSEEQVLVQDSISRFVLDNYDLSQRSEAVDQPHGFSVKNWEAMAELGWLSIPFAEENGGYGGGPVDTMVMMQELGRGLVAEPVLPTLLLFGKLIESAGNEAVKQELLPQVLEGQLQGAFAYHERQSRYDIADILTSARQKGDDWVLNGKKSVVLNGGAAEKLVVLARTSGDQTHTKGLSLFLVDATQQGLSRDSYRLIDGRDAANMAFSDVKADALLGDLGRAMDFVRPVIDAAVLAVSADALGAMEALNAQTVDYLKTRKQFGTPIGGFQSLQHRAVDMFAALENTKSLLFRAVCDAAGDTENARKSLLALKVMMGRSGRLIGHEAIQMHGGMGMSEEIAVGWYVKRLLTNNALFGDADFQQQKLIHLITSEADQVHD